MESCWLWSPIDYGVLLTMESCWLWSPVDSVVLLTMESCWLWSPCDSGVLLIMESCWLWSPADFGVLLTMKSCWLESCWLWSPVDFRLLLTYESNRLWSPIFQSREKTYVQIIHVFHCTTLLITCWYKEFKASILYFVVSITSFLCALKSTCEWENIVMNRVVTLHFFFFFKASRFLIFDILCYVYPSTNIADNTSGYEL